MNDLKLCPDQPTTLVIRVGHDNFWTTDFNRGSAIMPGVGEQAHGRNDSSILCVFHNGHVGVFQDWEFTGNPILQIGLYEGAVFFSFVQNLKSQCNQLIVIRVVQPNGGAGFGQ